MYKIEKYKNGILYETWKPETENNLNNMVKTFEKRNYEVVRKLGKNHVLLQKEKNVLANGKTISSDLYSIEIQPI